MFLEKKFLDWFKTQGGATPLRCTSLKIHRECPFNPNPPGLFLLPNPPGLLFLFDAQTVHHTTVHTSVRPGGLGNNLEGSSCTQQTVQIFDF